MAFSTLAQINVALPGQRLDFAKGNITVQAIGHATSWWASAGLPAAGATPSSGLAGDIPTKATAGAFGFVNPASGITQLARFVCNAAQTANPPYPYTLLLYDRLWHNSGIDATSTGAQTINSVALDRPDANGTDAEAWWHVYAAMGAGTPTVTLTYTNSGGTGSRSGSAVIPATTMAAGRTGPFTLAAGDTGVKSIQTWQADATFTSGTIDLVIRRLVALLPLGGYNAPPAIDAIGCGLPRVYDNACLELLFVASITGAIGWHGSLSLVNG